MKKCNDCKATKNLKKIWVEEDENGNWNPNKSCCKRCFFDNEYENESEVTKENWDDYDYNWKLKKKITVETNGEDKS